jgi:PAS domain S-box-containing protein
VREPGVPLRVLLVEDSENDALLLLRELRRGGYDPLYERVSTPEEMERAIEAAGSRREPWEVVVSDYYMPRFGALAALELLRRLGYDTPFVVVSGKIGEDAAVAMMRAGAQDYVTKEDMARLCPTIERELREAEGRRERKRAAQSLRFLSEASAELSSSLDYRATLAGVARLAVPQLADWCAVDVLEEDGSTHRLAVEHQNLEKVAWAHELQRRYPPDPDAPRGVPGVLRSGRSEFYAEIPDEMLVAAARDPEHLRIMREIGFTSAMFVPLVARGRTLGAITLISAESGRRYERADLELAEELARRAALAVDNARLYDEAQKEISERERAETRFRTLVEQIPAVTYIRSPHGAKPMEYVSPQIEDMLGYSPRTEAIDDEFLIGMLHPDDRERYLAEDRRTDQTGEPFKVEYRQFAKDGRMVWVRDEAVLVRDEGGHPLYWLGVQYDITEQKRVEEALKESEELYRSVVEQAAENIFLVDVETKRVLETNAALRRSLGYTPEEFNDMTLYDIVAHDRQSVDRNTEGIIEEGQRYLGERRYRRKDGSLVDVEVSASAILYGGAAAMSIVAHDITERKKAEEERSRLAAIVESSDDAILGKTLDGMITTWNRAAERLYGYSAEETVGQHISMLIPPDRSDEIREILRKVRRGENIEHLETVRVAKDGRHLDISVTLSPVRDPEGNIVGASAIARDITERKRVEEALDEAREAERNRIARDLHDDILQDIVFALQEIQVAQITFDNRRSEALEEAADAIRRSVEGLRGAIYELRLKETLGRSFVSSLEILVDLNRRMARRRYELDLVVEDEFPRDVPERTGREIVRIVQEALTNARRHAQPRRVRVRLWRDGDLARVEVADDGRGFDTGRPGIGVGQQSMRYRTRELGGKLEVESAPGGGTRVRFEVPVSRLLGEVRPDLEGPARSPSGDEGAPTA